MTSKRFRCVCRICTCTLCSVREAPGAIRHSQTSTDMARRSGHRVCTPRPDRCGCVARAVPSSRGGGITQMPELENSEAKLTDQIPEILAGYLTPKDLAQALGVSERTIARWHHFREGPPRVEFGRKDFCRLESVSAWIASCERPEARANRARRQQRLRAVAPSGVSIS